MAAALRLLQENRALPQDVFFGVTMPYPDATSGTLQVALAWLSLVGGIVPAWVALTIFGSALLALSFSTFAREATRSTPAALIAASLYFLTSVYLDMRDMALPRSHRTVPRLAVARLSIAVHALVRLARQRPPLYPFARRRVEGELARARAHVPARIHRRIRLPGDVAASW